MAVLGHSGSHAPQLMHSLVMTVATADRHTIVEAARLRQREDLPEAHHEHHIALDLVFAVHERVAAALLTARHREPDVAGNAQGDRRDRGGSFADLAPSVCDHDRPVLRASVTGLAV